MALLRRLKRDLLIIISELYHILTWSVCLSCVCLPTLVGATQAIHPNAVEIIAPDLQAAVVEAHQAPFLVAAEGSADDDNSASAVPRDAVPQNPQDSIDGINMDSSIVQNALMADVNMLKDQVPRVDQLVKRKDKGKAKADDEPSSSKSSSSSEISTISSPASSFGTSMSSPSSYQNSIQASAPPSPAQLNNLLRQSAQRRQQQTARNGSNSHWISHVLSIIVAILAFIIAGYLALNVPRKR